MTGILLSISHIGYSGPKRNHVEPSPEQTVESNCNVKFLLQFMTHKN